jgi:hypothetical protein
VVAGFGDDLPGDAALIEVHVGELKQLFNSLDPTPFLDRDLDPNAEEFIVGWAQEHHEQHPLALLVHLDRDAGDEAAAILKDAVHRFFEQRAMTTRRKLRRVLRNGRISLAIGLAYLAASIVAGDLIAGAMSETRFGGVFQESLLIGGWVAMWRPLEVFLYDWWPIRAEARLFDRLSRMAIRIAPSSDPGTRRRDQ